MLLEREGVFFWIITKNIFNKCGGLLKNRCGRKLRHQPSAFKHARATWMLKEGFSLKTVSNFLLGHSSTSITAGLYIQDSVDYDELFELDNGLG